MLIATGWPSGVAFAARPVARWLGQDGHDLVGGNPGPSRNDYQDIHIALKGLPTNHDLAEVVIHGSGDGEWKMSSKNQFTVLVVREGRSASADLYIEPYRRETGRSFEIKLQLDDGRAAEIAVQGGKADPNLRAPGRSVEVKWLGQDGQDRSGPGPGVGPDGFEDVHLSLARLSSKPEIKSVEVTGPGGLAWHSGLNPKTVAAAELVRDRLDRTRADLYLSPSRDLDRQALQVSVTYEDDRGDVASVVAGRCDPTRLASRIVPPELVDSPATARWLGQDGVGTALGDVHVSLEGLAPDRQVVAAALSDGVAVTWAYRSSDQVKLDAGPSTDRLDFQRSGDSTADLVFAPIRDESGATMTLRLLDPSGRQEVLRFPGGPCDPDRRGPALPSGTVDARPGDDLNDLASRFGTVTLSKGVYPLARPLVLARPVRMVGEPGATLRFSQGSDQPAWTAAIKVHAGSTSLEGFAVRFDGPIRWDREVSFGPAVIGTTDNRDNAPPDPKFRISLSRLDLEGPRVASGWEEATHLIRVVSASSGRIERNTLKGGAVLFSGGPWSIVENSSGGTLPNTFSYNLFAGRYTHDLVLAGNKVRDVGPSGKTWRFLVLAQRGANDLIKDNVIGGGVGAREDDPHQHENSPEVILTESYRLQFEGKPASISPDGRVLVLPPLQRDPASTGDSLAILSGPQAGQWRTIAQPLGPRGYLLDAPISRETDAVSIAPGFVRETFEGNTVDCRGGGITHGMVLAGNLFGVKVLRNHLIGGRMAIRLLASATEEPVHWGWSHAPFLGGLVEGNILEDAPEGEIGVEHGGIIKSNQGRVYMSVTMKDNTLRWTKSSGTSGKPPRLAIGLPPSLDPGELIVTESGTKIEGAPAQAAWVHSSTINGQVVRESPLTTRGPVGAKPSTTTRRD